MMTIHETIPSGLELQFYKSLENEDLIRRIEQVRGELGSRLLILGHHYQQDEVIAQADLRGDSYRDDDDPCNPALNFWISP